MADKLRDPEFTADIGPLLATGFTWDVAAAGQVLKRIEETASEQGVAVKANTGAITISMERV